MKTMKRTHSNAIDGIVVQAVGLFLAATSVYAQSLSDGLQAYWKFDETKDPWAFDSSGKDNIVLLLDFPGSVGPWTDGAVGGAIEFDGILSRGICGNPPSLNELTSEATISFWIRPKSFGEREVVADYSRAASNIFQKGNHFGVRIIDDPGTVRRTLVVTGAPGGGGGVDVALHDDEVSAPPMSVDLDVWQHFSVVYKGGSVTFYKNGYQIGDPVDGMLGNPVSDTFVLGSATKFPMPRRYYRGGLDELSIWSRPLSEMELLEVAGKDASEPPSTGEDEPLNIRTISMTGPGWLNISFFTPIGGRPYRIEWSGDLVAGVWTKQTNVQISNNGGGEFNVVFSAPVSGVRFYRVAAIP